MYIAEPVVRRLLSGLSVLLICFVTLTVSSGAWASATCTGGPQTVTMNMPSSVTVPRDAAVGTMLTGWIMSPATTIAITPTSVTALSCITPSVTADLGNHMLSEMGGVGATTSTTSFNIALNSCPGGLGTIKYQIDPTTALLNSANSVVAFDSSSTASGAGAQLLDGSGAVFPLSTPTRFSGYSTATGGSYTIPFKSRYYRTSATIGAGTANTSMTFTMNYQ